MIERDDIMTQDGTKILVHADGGNCHGTPIRRFRTGGHYCPRCGIAPDMQSTEFWPPNKVKL